METKKRSWVKSITWRLLGLFILGAIAFLLTEDWVKATGISVAFHLVRLVLYYYHERVWQRVQWGKRRSRIELVISPKLATIPIKILAEYYGITEKEAIELVKDAERIRNEIYRGVG